MAYTLEMARESLEEYRGLHDTAFLLAMMRLDKANYYGPRALRAEASRLRQAFYVYNQGFEYGRP